MILVPALPVPAQSLSTTEGEVSREVNSELTDTPLTTADLERSRAWGLTEVEWLRYQGLLLGIRGSVSPANLSPIEVLGIHARDDAERRRYAELWAQAMFEDAERILAFQRAYDAAVRRLHPSLLIIDNQGRDRAPARSPGLKREDRVLFFTRLNCPACDAVLGRLLERLDGIGGVDVYITDVPSSDDTAIRQWASNRAIRPDWVRSGRVSLNHDKGILRRVGGSTGDIPALFVRRGDDIRTLEYADL